MQILRNLLNAGGGSKATPKLWTGSIRSNLPMRSKSSLKRWMKPLMSARAPAPPKIKSGPSGGPLGHLVELGAERSEHSED
ncbi:hypothetical protein SAMN03159423_0480 [Bradyrhizobium sp. NFR13]|uniref:hypothetical protein n=1 Tax=Bradyrhizobium sp. NFR13 TaxID=1566285 RepID=UPI0008EF0C14|nr:hypothetical protein [Bradyrhizobium sp. NFR13]SFM29672.1 hypothetical protein SAMN03159423_0480 [Bradyrhizobium sp. NFR13]